MSIRRASLRYLGVSLCLAFGGLALGACAPLERSHGYLPDRALIDELIIGGDTMASVEESIGRPQDEGMRDGQSWYYVQNTVSTFLFLAPEVKDRTVLALDFDRNGILSDISQFGLADGQVINLVTRITPTDRRRRSLLNQLFGNVGALTPPLPG